MRGRCASILQKMRIKLAQSVHRSAIDGDEKYFPDHVQSFIVVGKRKNERGGEKGTNGFVKKSVLWYFIWRGIGSCAPEIVKGHANLRNLAALKLHALLASIFQWTKFSVFLRLKKAKRNKFSRILLFPCICSSLRSRKKKRQALWIAE